MDGWMSGWMNELINERKNEYGFRQPSCTYIRISWGSVSSSNPVSRGQCHLIYLTILRRFFWPSLAYNVQKWGLKPHSFHFHHDHK